MRLASLIPLTLCLTACGSQSTRLEVSARVPVPPELGQQVAATCPPARLLTDALISTLAAEDPALAVEYAKCQERHRAAVEAYNKNRADIIKFKADLAAEGAKK